MALSIKDKLFARYPIPRSLSIWGGDGVSTFAVSDLDALVETCVDELRADLYVTEYITLTGMSTGVDPDVFAVVNARIIGGNFQGNTSVRVQLDRASNTVLCRYTPARATVRRYLRVSDLDTLQGAQLQYFLVYTLWRMATTELAMLRAVTLSTDAGSINLDTLASFAESCSSEYERMKEDIHLYTTGI